MSVHQFGAWHSASLATMALQQHLRNDAPSQHTSFPERGNHRVRQVLIARGPVILGIMQRIVGVSNERQWPQEHTVQSSCIQMRLQEGSETVSTLNCRKILWLSCPRNVPGEEGIPNTHMLHNCTCCVKHHLQPGFQSQPLWHMGACSA